ncbi:cytochrome c [Sphingomonas zeicaulis]|uniref:c-type cytochrome n=1 Tax=Sphingomonas zeicaulis TaxID=1632740 RepID=UPI003D239352
MTLSLRAPLAVILLIASALAAPAATAADGSMIFRQRCQMCHVTVPKQKAGLGPNLAGVLGRKAASTEFLYSPALKGTALKWDKPTLDKFLAGPTKMVPGTRMVITVGNPADRAALIDYLATLKK